MQPNKGAKLTVLLEMSDCGKKFLNQFTCIGFRIFIILSRITRRLLIIDDCLKVILLSLRLGGPTILKSEDVSMTVLVSFKTI